MHVLLIQVLPNEQEIDTVQKAFQKAFPSKKVIVTGYTRLKLARKPQTVIEIYSRCYDYLYEAIDSQKVDIYICMEGTGVQNSHNEWVNFTTVMMYITLHFESFHDDQVLPQAKEEKLDKQDPPPLGLSQSPTFQKESIERLIEQANEESMLEYMD